MKRVLIPAMMVALAACTTPPIDTPHASSSVTLSQMTGGAISPGFSGMAPVPAVPAFRMPVVPIDVPPNAASANLAEAILHVTLTNRMTIPLTLKISLSKSENPYDDPSASFGDAVEIQPGASKQLDKSVDPTLFKQPKVYFGMTFSTPGTGLTPVAIKGSDSLDLESWATVKVKLL
ncbi:hypothetical protein D3C86_1103900 [compost metagenome]